MFVFPFNFLTLTKIVSVTPYFLKLDHVINYCITSMRFKHGPAPGLSGLNSIH